MTRVRITARLSILAFMRGSTLIIKYDCLHVSKQVRALRKAQKQVVVFVSLGDTHIWKRDISCEPTVITGIGHLAMIRLTKRADEIKHLESTLVRSGRPVVFDPIRMGRGKEYLLRNDIHPIQ